MTNLVRWEPFRDLISLREAMNRLFEESVVQPAGGWLTPMQGATLAVDMYETDDAIVVKSALPGLNADDVNISITADTLTIKGETKAEEEIQEENYICREQRYGSFSRTLPIPVSVVADEAEAEFENGILTLTLPKAEEVKPKAIQVKAKGKK
ncbi:MAG TPA: Hsp20/alpha crystallin family protein [Chloroflexi bacterium]|nr:Hsp20/alpha crystallin family protein [Chloroflexota bacterium]